MAWAGGWMIWAFHGMVLWVMHWESMDLHWGWSLGIPWKCSMHRPLGYPHGTPMALHGYCSIGAPWECLMGNRWGSPHVASMAWAGGLMIGHAMEWFYG